MLFSHTGDRFPLVFPLRGFAFPLSSSSFALFSLPQSSLFALDALRERGKDSEKEIQRDKDAYNEPLFRPALVGSRMRWAKMPALKMTTSNAGGARGRHLHSSLKSNKISKVARVTIKELNQDALLDAGYLLPHDVPLHVDRPCHNGLGLELNCCQGRLHYSNSILMESTFSSILDHKEFQLKVVNNGYSAGEEQLPELSELVPDDVDDGICNSSKHQSRSGWDINNLGDFEVAALPFDDSIGFFDVITSTYSQYKYQHTDIIDKDDREEILPLLEKAEETCVVNHEKSIEDGLKTDDSCLYLAIHQVKSSNLENDINYKYTDLDAAECSDPYLYIRNLPDLSDAVGANLLSKDTQKRSPITLVLDLDETLVHSTLEHCEDADFTFPVFFNMKEHTVYVRRRPHLQTFLERVAEMFEIVVFTASKSIYAEQLLDVLDPKGELISKRIYREACIFSDGSYMKDLTILGRDLAKVVIIDNSPQVFRLQVNNGIPIQSWFNDSSDHALISLLPFLEILAKADDVRPIIAEQFSIKE